MIPSELALGHERELHKRWAGEGFINPGAANFVVGQMSARAFRKRMKDPSIVAIGWENKTRKIETQ